MSARLLLVAEWPRFVAQMWDILWNISAMAKASDADRFLEKEISDVTLPQNTERLYEETRPHTFWEFVIAAKEDTSFEARELVRERVDAIIVRPVQTGCRDAEIEIRGRLAVAAKRTLGDGLPNGFRLTLSTVSEPATLSSSDPTPEVVWAHNPVRTRHKAPASGAAAYPVWSTAAMHHYS